MALADSWTDFDDTAIRLDSRKVSVLIGVVFASIPAMSFVKRE